METQTASSYLREAVANDRTEQQARTARRYCQDCRFFEDGLTAARKPYGRCAAPPAPASDVDRFIAPEFDKPPFASTMRSIESLCGPTGKWFETAQPGDGEGSLCK